MSAFFFVFAFILIFSAISVVAFKNPIHSALALVLNFFTIGCVFASLDAHFLAAAQIIVYAGAIMVLVLFVLMLLNIKLEASPKREFFYIGLSSVAAIVFLKWLTSVIVAGLKGDIVPPANFPGGAAEIGKILYTRYAFPFEAASVLIIAAIAGAVMLAKRRYRDS